MDQGGSGLMMYKVSETEGEDDVYYGDEYEVDGALVTVTRVAGSYGRIEVDYSTADGLPNGLANGDVTATADVDYIPVSGTLTFDDFEMSKSIVIPVFNSGLAEPNRDFTVQLSNPRLDPNESTEVSQPRVDEIFGTAMVRILSEYANPNDEILETVNLSTNPLVIPFQFTSEIDLTVSNGAPKAAKIPFDLQTNDSVLDLTGLTTNTFDYGATNILVGSPFTNTFTYTAEIYTNQSNDPVTFSFTNKLSLGGLVNGAQQSIYFTNPISLTIPLNVVTNSLTWTSPTNDTFNFQSAHYRFLRQNGTYTIYVTRNSLNGQATNLYYRVNNYFLSKSGNSEERNIYFPLQAGSDYAVPTPATTGGVDGRNSDFNLANGTLSWGKGDSADKAITFTIANDGLPEFNKDFQIEIYAEDNNGNVIQGGMVAETDVTILFNPADPPAGSVDEILQPGFWRGYGSFREFHGEKSGRGRGGLCPDCLARQQEHHRRAFPDL